MLNSRRLHQTSLACGELRLGKPAIRITGEVCCSEAFATIFAGAKADRLRSR